MISITHQSIEKDTVACAVSTVCTFQDDFKSMESYSLNSFLVLFGSLQEPYLIITLFAAEIQEKWRKILLFWRKSRSYHVFLPIIAPSFHLNFGGRSLRWCGENNDKLILI